MMLKQVILRESPAYKVKATQIRRTPKAALYNLEGDQKWIPHTVCKYNAEEETLLIVDWFYKKEIEL